MDEFAVTVCEMMLDTVAKAETLSHERRISFLREQRRKVFSAAYALASKYLPGTISIDFALLALAGMMNIENQSDAARLSQEFLEDIYMLKTYKTLDEIVGFCSDYDEQAALVIRKMLAEIDEKLLSMKALAEQAEHQNTIEQSDQIINICVVFIKKAQEKQKRKFTDEKYVKYYAYFLAFLERKGLSVREHTAEYFSLVGKRIEFRTASCRAAMEYKFYHIFLVCHERFEQKNEKDAIIDSLSIVERETMRWKKTETKLMHIGMRATEILERAIHDIA